MRYTVLRRAALGFIALLTFACHVPGHYEAGMLLPITAQ